MISQTILNNTWVRYVVILFIGITVGAVFYPTKTIEKKTSQKYEQQISQMKSEYDSYKSSSDQKISTLTSQVSDLSSHQKIIYSKTTHPDGTVEIHQTTVNSVTQSDKTDSESNQDTVSKIQNDSLTKEQGYQNTISSLEQQEKITKNQKHISLEVGMMSDKNYYVHSAADLWGPVFVGIQGEIKSAQSDTNAENKVGLGIGIRF